MYRAKESFTTKNYDVKRKQILQDDFTTQDEISEFLDIGYIEVYDGSLEITENGTYNVKDYDQAEVNVGGGELPKQYATLDYTGVTSGNLTYAIREISDLDLTGVTNCNGVFSSMGNLRKMGKIKNTSSVTSCYNMFSYCTSLTEIDLSEFNTSNITVMEGMFKYCSALVSINLSNFNTSNVTDVNKMFQSCGNLTTIVFGNKFTLQRCTNNTSLDRMFSGCTALNNDTLNEILKVIATYGGTNKQLSELGFTPAQITTCKGLSNWPIAEAAGWA